MPSITTQIIGPAAAAITANQQSATVQRQGAAQHVSPEKIAAASQIKAKEESTRLDQKNERINVQIPKRVEPNYGPQIKKKVPKRDSEHEKQSQSNEDQHNLDKLA